MEGGMHARLLNAGGELIAEGSCRVDERAGTATLEPEREPGVLQKERGLLAIELESGRTLRVSDKPIVFRVWPPKRGNGTEGRRTMYRFHIIRPPQADGVEGAQDARAAGGAGEGAPAPPERETPAAS